jgi:hypothetical protein
VWAAFVFAGFLLAAPVVSVLLRAILAPLPIRVALALELAGWALGIAVASGTVVVWIRT